MASAGFYAGFHRSALAVAERSAMRQLAHEGAADEACAAGDEEAHAVFGHGLGGMMSLSPAEMVSGLGPIVSRLARWITSQRLRSL